MSFSQIIIVGHLGTDPELKYTKTQTPVINLSVGSHERLRPTDPIDKRPKTYWHKCRKFGKLAETYKSMLKKGDKVFLKGQLVYDSWEDRSGRHHKDAIIEIDYLEKMHYENVTIDLGE
tara:strand:+ start:1215 stop:1571 length:357 start_codon:yes stop_codon:yes gene_type:complete